MRNPEHSNEIICSSTTLLSPLTLPLLGIPLEAWIVISRTLGYQGLEWRPTRSLAEMQLQSGLVTPSGKHGIKSGEQSYRGERSWKKASAHSNKRLAQASYLLFPHKLDSIDNLIRLQSTIGDLTVTVYPPENQEEKDAQRPLRNKLVQLAPDCMRIWNCDSLEPLVERIVTDGYEINFDVLHYLRLTREFNLPSHIEALKLILPHIQEIQFPVGRSDIKLPGETGVQTYNDLLDDTRLSQETQLLTLLLEMGCKAPIIPEVNPMVLGIAGTLKAHKIVTKGLRSLIG